MRFVALVLLCAGLVHAQKPGMIRGVVAAPSGFGLEGAVVSAIPIFVPDGKGEASPVSRASTSKVGAFVVSNLMPGSYRICVAPGVDNLLDPCAWSEDPPTWNLSEGEIATTYIRIDEGVYLDIDVEDPEEKLEINEKQRSQGPAIRVLSVSHSGSIALFREIETKSKQRTLRALLPKNSDVNLSVYSEFNIEDEKGAPAKTPESAAPLKIRTSTSNSKINLRVK